MKYYEIELDGELIKLRLRSEDCIAIEEKNKCKMLDYVRDYSHTTVITLLRYLRKSEIPQFSQKDACDLMDKFIDNGYTLDKIIYEVIYEALVVSGFLTKQDLEEVKNMTNKVLETQKEKTQEVLQK